MACCLPGCSLFVMAGKMILGDPKQTAQFKQQTGVDLIKDEKTVLVVCSTPEFAKYEAPSLELDVVDGLVQRLQRRGIRVVNPDEVFTWIDDQGGRWDDLSQLANAFDTDYIIHVQLDRIGFREDNSPTMFRGQAEVKVAVHSVHKINGVKRIKQVFEPQFKTEYPRLHPIPAETLSAETFQRRFVDHLNDHVARYFYNFRISEVI